MLKPLWGQWLLLSILVKLWVSQLLYTGVRYVCRLVTLHFPLVEVRGNEWGNTSGTAIFGAWFSWKPNFLGGLLKPGRLGALEWLGFDGVLPWETPWWHATKSFFSYLWRIILLSNFFLNCISCIFWVFCFLGWFQHLCFSELFTEKVLCFKLLDLEWCWHFGIFCSAPRSWDGPMGHTCPVHTVTHGSGLRSRNCHWQGWLYQEVMWNLREPASFCKVTRVSRWPRNLGHAYKYDLSVVCVDWKLITD